MVDEHVELTGWLRTEGEALSDLLHSVIGRCGDGEAKPLLVAYPLIPQRDRGYSEHTGAAPFIQIRSMHPSGNTRCSRPALVSLRHEQATTPASDRGLEAFPPLIAAWTTGNLVVHARGVRAGQARSPSHDCNHLLDRAVGVHAANCPPPGAR